MTSEAKRLRQELRGAGISDSAIDAAWPSWWSDDLDGSPSGRTELRFTLARKLGLSPRPLLGERVEFVWKDRARFKHLATKDQVRQDALSSFGVTVGRLLLQANQGGPPLNIDPLMLRNAVLKSSDYVDLRSLITFGWAMGIPIIHLRVFPLEQKSMHAMVVEDKGRYAILLGRDSNYPAPVAFTLAHEIGHVMLGHLTGSMALVDMDEGEDQKTLDPQEAEADEYAITLLTGAPDPQITTSTPSFTARSLANAALEEGQRHRIEPGSLALCLAHRTDQWPVSMASLRYIYSTSKPVWQEVNMIARNQLNFDVLTEESAEFLQKVMFGTND